MERFDESLERQIDPVLDAEYIKQLGSLGIWDARVDFYNFYSSYHPEDNKWAVNPDLGQD